MITYLVGKANVQARVKDVSERVFQEHVAGEESAEWGTYRIARGR